MIVVEEMASGGDIIPPRRNPRAREKPGINSEETNAITPEVITTIGKAKLMITRRHFQNSFHDTCQAASYKRGGRKMKNTYSGLIVIFEKPAKKLRAKPPITRTMG
jgi:hypothetical protein